MNYFLIADDSVQYFDAIVASDLTYESNPPKFGVCEIHEIPVGFSCPFLNRIRDRRVNFSNQKFYGVPEIYSTCYGWDISVDQFNQIKEFIKLYPAHEKFEELCE